MQKKVKKAAPLQCGLFCCVNDYFLLPVHLLTRTK